MKKILVLSCLFLAILFVLIGCSPSEKDKNDIIKDIKNHSGFFDIQDIEINKINIIKRQTNKAEKTDYLYVTVFAHFDDIEYELGYYLTYNLYNDGWVLDNIERDQEGVWVISKATEEQMLTDLYNDYFIQGKGLSITNLSVNEYIDTDEQTTYNVYLSFDAGNDDVFFVLEYSLSYLLMIDGWKLINSSITRSHAMPLNTISQREIDNNIAEYTQKQGYDSISLNDRKTDLTDNFDELTYTATKRLYYVDEIYEVKLIPIFDQRQGEWSISSYSLIENIVKRNWDLVGTWEATWRDPPFYNNTIEFTMNIIEVTDSHIRANGTVSKDSSKDWAGFSYGGFDEQFDIDAQFTVTDSRISFTVVKAQLYATSTSYTFTVNITSDSVKVRYNNLHGEYGNTFDGGKYQVEDLYRTGY